MYCRAAIFSTEADFLLIFSIFSGHLRLLRDKNYKNDEMKGIAHEFGVNSRWSGIY